MRKFIVKGGAEVVRAEQFIPEPGMEEFCGYPVVTDKDNLQSVTVRAAWGKEVQSFGGDWLTLHENGDIGLMDNVAFRRTFVAVEDEETENQETEDGADDTDTDTDADQGENDDDQSTAAAAISTDARIETEADASNDDLREFVANAATVKQIKMLVGEDADINVGDIIKIPADAEIEDAESKPQDAKTDDATNESKDDQKNDTNNDAKSEPADKQPAKQESNLGGDGTTDLSGNALIKSDPAEANEASPSVNTANGEAKTENPETEAASSAESLPKIAEESLHPPRTAENPAGEKPIDDRGEITAIKPDAAEDTAKAIKQRKKAK